LLGIIRPTLKIYLLYKTKPLELWQVQKNIHKNVCLKITDFTSYMQIHIFMTELHFK